MGDRIGAANPYGNNKGLTALIDKERIERCKQVLREAGIESLIHN